MDLRRLLLAVLPVAAAAGIGGLGARDAPQVYRRLGKPRWAPPAAAFGPVWSVLYVGTAAAGWRMYGKGLGTSTLLHLVQLALNAGWPVVFFSVRDKRASLLVIGLLDAVLLAEILTLRRKDPVAASLLVPYLCWSGFATALNATVTEPQQ